MARVTGDDQTCTSTTSTLESRTSKLRDSRQTDCDVMSVLIRSGADVLLANLAYGHDTLPLHAKQLFWHSRILKEKNKKKLEKKTGYL